MKKKSEKKPRVLCLHGHGASGEILKKEMELGWPQIVLEKLDLVFLNGPFLLQDKVDSHDIFHPPYYEWFQKDSKEIYHFEECVQYVEANMEKYGPFDGVLGFSQGAIVTATMPGMQRERVVLTKIPNIKFVIIISGFKFGAPEFGCPKLAANAYSSPIECPSLHFIGEKETKKTSEEELVKCFVNPVVIHHPEGHKVPNLDAESVKTVIAFINKVKKIKMALQGNSKM
ncbi:dihydrofolate reductase isoform X2 [Nicotiana tabacum]|uniref:Dihydrofolate reductase isoform X1 n=1 Tax=Nicotiana tabacum TaxID=4097 RepID=A0A1S4CIY6_TOBAC|nr:PREDICTED: dihydrofolate reductase-like isoform X1 [Nicotiana tabacum]